MSTLSLDSITVEEDVYVFPASFFQESLWFLSQLEPNRAAYNMASTIQFTGMLNLTVLEQALNTIVQRHEALRTTFTVEDEQLVQVISPSRFIPLQMVDLRTLSKEERETATLRIVKEDAQRPFDLVHGPLLRTTLLLLDTEEHMLVLNMHHIISDEWSLRVLCNELAALYEAFLHDLPSPLPQPQIQYADFAVWQRQHLQGEVLETQLSYWQQQLNHIPTLLELPTDHPRPAVQTFQGARYSFVLSEEITDALRVLSRREGTTLFMTLLAAFNLLLYRYTGQTDITVGSPIANRNHSGMEELIGFFVNTLVLRTDLSDNPTFVELLKQVRKDAIEAYAHQDLPFERLVEELHPERNLSYNPLFQVMFTLQTAPLTTFNLPGLHMRIAEVENETAKFDLSLTLKDTGQEMVGFLEYNTDLFEPTTISRMGGHFQKVLEGIITTPQQRISDLPLLTEQQRHQLLVEWNPPSEDFPHDQCIHQLIEAQVERTPQAIAVMCDGQQLTYHELNRRANQLAHLLQARGVEPEVLVGICMQRSLDMLVGLLAILKAGGVYVPLDPDAPPDRLAFLLEDTHMPLLLTHQPLLARFPSSALPSQVFCLDTERQTLSQYSEANPVSEVTAEHLAYVIYTSGSTGQPKGVLIEHHALAAHCQAMVQSFELRAEDRVLQFSAFTFDVSLEQLLPSLLVGARVVMRGQEVWSADELWRAIIELGLTVVNVTPAYMQHVLEEWRQTPQQWQAHQLRLLILGGDRVLPNLLKMWRQMPLQSVRLLNAYGPTETTITATLFDMSQAGEHEPAGEIVPIGRPLPHRTVYLLDASGTLVPVGMTGELHIGGSLLARGYLNRPELTAERFIADPFSQQPHARLYKTGDVARYRADGTIEFLGRMDHQVKLRGFRIELGEIEAALRQHPAVRETIVVIQEDTPGERYLVAYVVPKGETVESNLLWNYLKQKLPAYMVPTAFVQLESLPLMSNGKVDRRALPVSKVNKSAIKETFVAPEHKVHQQLVQIWEELLNVQPIGIKDNFFFLGGHSLLAARLVSRIEQIFGKRIPLTTLFTGPTIEQLANALQDDEDLDLQAPLVAVQQGGSRRPFFFLHGDYKGGAFYCIPLAQGLGADQPFYALEPFKFDDLQSPPTLESVATAHINLLRTVQPKGPYLLGGFCNGGLVAYEMARQLHTEGETVDLLALINPTPVGYLRFSRTVIKHIGDLMGLGQNKQLTSFLWTRHMYRYLQHVYRYLRFPSYRSLQTELDPEQVKQNGGTILTLKALHELWLSFDKESEEIDEQVGPRPKVHFALPRLTAIFPDVFFPTTEALHHDWGGLFHWMAAAYEPGYYPGKSTFFFSWDWHSEEPLPDIVQWRKVAKAKDREVEMHTITGTHDTCKTTYLHDLTEQLRMCLNSVQQELV